MPLLLGLAQTLLKTNSSSVADPDDLSPAPDPYLKNNNLKN